MPQKKLWDWKKKKQVHAVTSDKWRVTTTKILCTNVSIEVTKQNSDLAEGTGSGRSVTAAERAYINSIQRGVIWTLNKIVKWKLENCFTFS